MPMRSRWISHIKFAHTWKEYNRKGRFPANFLTLLFGIDTYVEDIVCWERFNSCSFRAKFRLMKNTPKLPPDTLNTIFVEQIRRFHDTLGELRRL